MAFVMQLVKKLMIVIARPARLLECLVSGLWEVAGMERGGLGEVEVEAIEKVILLTAKLAAPTAISTAEVLNLNMICKN